MIQASRRISTRLQASEGRLKWMRSVSNGGMAVAGKVDEGRRWCGKEET